MKYPLHDAIVREDVDAARLAIANGADPYVPVRDTSSWYNNKTPLDLAANMEDPEKQGVVTGLLVELGVCDYGNSHYDWKRPFNTAHAEKKTAFIDAVRDTPAYQAWEEHKARADVQALWKNSEAGNQKDVKRLLEEGVNPNAEIPVKYGRKTITSTPLEAAASPEVFDLLVAHGATLPTDPTRQTRMMLLPARYGALALLDRMDRMGVSDHLGQAKTGGNDPLWVAAVYGQKDAVDWLLAHGADPNGVSKQGKTRTIPLDAVLASKYFSIDDKISLGQRLIDAGAKPEISDTRWKWEGDHRGPFLAALKQHQLGRLAQTTRKDLDLADDLADVEEVQARQTRGRFM